MMFTNKYGLPAPLVLAACGDAHWQSGKYSISQLSKPVQQVMLEKKFGHEFISDASSRLWAMLGIAAHEVIHKSRCFEMVAVAGKEGVFNVVPLNDSMMPSKHAQEIRLEVEVQTPFGRVPVSGTFDHYDTELRELNDWKVTSVYSFLAGGKEEWEQQLNAYAYALVEKGYPAPKKLNNFLILRDWRPSEYKQDQRRPEGERRGYPPVPFVCVENNLWTRSQQAEWITSRIILFEKNIGALPTELPPCLPEETWGGRRCAEYCDAALYCEQKKEADKQVAAALASTTLEAAGVKKRRKNA